MKSIHPAFLAFLILLPFASQAASTRVDWFNSLGTELGDSLGNPLKAGTPADFDGSALQLGYYSAATPATPFAGNWIPLTGFASHNDQLSSVGDKGNQPMGRFSITSAFILGSPTYGNDLPAEGVPLSIRFYDSFSPSSSIFYNGVSDSSGAWNWISPADPQAVVSINLTTPGVTWEGGSGSAFRTTINIVPEPGTTALLLLGIACCFWRRTLSQA